MKTKRNNYGVTLVELIIVIAIIAIMTAAVYVVRKPADDKGKIELTQATIELLCGAIEQYHNFYNEFPDVNSMDTTGYFGGLNLTLAERLSYRLSLCPDALAILNKINPKMITNDYGSIADYLEYIDAWGEPLKYEYIKTEEWNFPLIRSAGPDKKFGTVNDPNSDDITSRK